MAKQVINIGTTANDGTGDPLRSAFDKVNDNFTELYTDDAGDVNSVNAGTGITVNSTTGAVTVTNSLPNATHSGDVTGSAALTIAADAVTYAKMQNLATGDRVLGATSAGVIGEVQIAPDMIADDAVTTDKINNDAVTTDKLANSINSAITANTAKTTNANHTGDVTGSGALTIGNDKVTFATLENRYTALSALGSGSSFALNFITATTFTATATGAATFTFSNAVQGQVIDLIVTGDYALTFAETGSTFNKVGSTSYAGASTNLIQIVCTKDTSGSRIYHYSIATFAAAQPQ